jgi:hypothetical protein
MALCDSNRIIFLISSIRKRSNHKANTFMADISITPRLSGFARRLVEDGHISEDKMLQAVEGAKKSAKSCTLFD